MVKLKEELWKTLQGLKEGEFETFKWFLKEDGIPVADLENAKRQDAVDLIVQKYQSSGALKVTLKILENIHRNDLVELLQNLHLEPKDAAKKKEYKGKKPKLEWVQQFAVDVILDHHTAHPDLILSGDRKQVRHGNVRKRLPNNPERFNHCVNILGKQGFSSGKFYFEVQVKGKIAWDLGVSKESVERKIQITATPENGYWVLILRNGYDCGVVDGEPILLSLNQYPQKVGVFVDCDEGLVVFYDVDAADILYIFHGCSFNEKIYPFFSPCTNDGGINAAPLILTPVNPPLNEHEKKKAELKNAQQYEVEVTLDPDTAHPNLILSDDGKRVHHGDERKKLLSTPQRFNNCVSILGKQSFTSGKFYFEVQVKGKTAWDLGVATESIKRKAQIITRPHNGYWSIMLRNEFEYEANDDDPVSLSLNPRPQRVGVFVDYDEGLVFFYDVDTADCLYSFAGCYFNEKLYPYFSPCTNDDGINSTPLIIIPVYQETQDIGDQKAECESEADELSSAPLHSLKHKTCDSDGENEENQTKKTELKSAEQPAVDVTPDANANSNLLVFDDGEQVHNDDDNVSEKSPNNFVRTLFCCRCCVFPSEKE
ncbi:uncharacterized protein LOC121961488 [Plectropomus leopardus]|uniref:uncharacterized protein LOC121961488 n=1 Tax=Plectropomus leopardus TaxID=160734 RepID=UPI001C4CE203|nr:uncharacterized protein LOC121961488 [Plectropomus leopardus]XP_042367424.1 uncharacterized protein LOC121961488 [Plectropomus leopardus]XP_042367426.1 uncharacterized protein LOC121961488 [Plectropomus leopardus]